MNILMLTNIYPLKDVSSKGLTPVVNYFCEEWVRRGHKVFVVNSTSQFPPYYYMLPNFMKELVENKVGFSLPNKHNNREILTESNGVIVFQLPYRKMYPGQSISSNRLKLQYEAVVNKLEEYGFVPSVILGHWVNPQLQLISLLKSTFKDVKTSLIIHSIPTGAELKILRSEVHCLDYMGFRNKTIKLKTEDILDLTGVKPFYCYSGVKDYFGKADEDFSYKEFSTSPVKIAFVGNLIKRKFPLTILAAADHVSDVDFNIKIIGDGPELKKLRRYNTARHIQLDLLGRLDRQGVYKVLEDSSIFIMISKNEAFGLVYLEAMLNRNIVIASRGDGFDGIIEDGVNGFLCEPGDGMELSNILKKIIKMSREKLIEIQKESFLTATKMTDRRMAEAYLNTVAGKDKLAD